jgi:hypothetical protein
MVETKPSLTVGPLPRDAQSHCIVTTSMEEFAGTQPQFHKCRRL